MTPPDRTVGARTTAEINPIEAEHYGSKTLAVEPGGVDVVPLGERHGAPRQMFWTWISPNLEFATIGVGILGVLFFGLTFWQSVAAIILGTGLGSITHAIVSSWGPSSGMCQMVLSLVDRYLRRGSDVTGLLTDRGYRNWAGPIAMAVGMVLSIWLFSNQQRYVGPVPTAYPNAGDLTFEVGFLVAACLYAVLFRVLPPRSATAPAPATTASPTRG